MIVLKNILASFMAFSGGFIIAGGVFAFIAIIGIVPRLAEKTKTEDKAMIYEEAIIFGGICGSMINALRLSVPIGIFFSIIGSFFGGIFLGCLAMSLAEVLDVIPIFTRRVEIKQGLFFFILSIATGKLVGSILYYVIPGFYKA